MIKIIGIIAVVLLPLSALAWADCEVCDLSFGNEEKKGEAMATFEKLAEEATVKDGVREITYEQFNDLRDSGDKYVLLDVLSQESYETRGHIEGARSLPSANVSAKTASGILSKDDKVVVYCGSFTCGASSKAAKILSGLGYDVLDYKGGLKEWMEKGNAVEK